MAPPTRGQTWTWRGRIRRQRRSCPSGDPTISTEREKKYTKVDFQVFLPISGLAQFSPHRQFAKLEEHVWRWSLGLSPKLSRVPSEVPKVSRQKVWETAGTKFFFSTRSAHYCPPPHFLVLRGGSRLSSLNWFFWSLLRLQGIISYRPCVHMPVVTLKAEGGGRRVVTTDDSSP